VSSQQIRFVEQGLSSHAASEAYREDRNTGGSTDNVKTLGNEDPLQAKRKSYKIGLSSER